MNKLLYASKLPQRESNPHLEIESLRSYTELDDGVENYFDCPQGCYPKSYLYRKLLSNLRISLTLIDGNGFCYTIKGTASPVRRRNNLRGTTLIAGLLGFEPRSSA